MPGCFNSELGALADPRIPTSPLNLEGQELVELCRQLETMILIRRTEECIAEMVTAGLTGTPCHLGIGQEAIAAGVCANLEITDRIFGGHRSHGPFLAMGSPVTGLLAEVLGRATGCSKGMGGSMHLQDMSRGFWGSAPIVGGTVPIAVGAALAARMDGGDSIAVCFFGDGALEEGGVQESMNLASTLGLPVLFVCENNLYASHMDISQRQPSDRMARFADAHKITCMTIDGNNIVDVNQAAKELVHIARRREGPAFLEAVTYRWRGHVGPREDIDVGVRRREEDLVAWKRRDPISRLVDAMTAAGMLGIDEFEKMNARITSTVAAAKEEALSAPYPVSSQTQDLVWHNRKGGTEL